MEQACRGWLEPRYQGVHDLMVRLLGRCTCENEARVVELYLDAAIEVDRFGSPGPHHLSLVAEYVRGGDWPRVEQSVG